MRRKVIGIFVFLEKRKNRILVGSLEKKDEKFVFTYDEKYFKAKNIIPLGPEFPLTQKQFTSEKLFPSLEDRIPSQQNPAYSEYCQLMGIDPKERNPFILLSTIGKKGPSSFIFHAIFERKINGDDLIQFRKLLGLTTREFAAVFEFSQASLNAFETGRTSGKDIVKRLETLLNFPTVAVDLLLLNGGYLAPERRLIAAEKLKERALVRKD
ncbi:MAG: HipA N-terminal domain-containing protein [Verrucomicrobia bacterium]|nr:HipA N-terminal domain-containing protein [Verrucomicrobiota bacterium]